MSVMPVTTISAYTSYAQPIAEPQDTTNDEEFDAVSFAKLLQVAKAVHMVLKDQLVELAGSLDRVDNALNAVLEVSGIALDVEPTATLVSSERALPQDPDLDEPLKVPATRMYDNLVNAEVHLITAEFLTDGLLTQPMPAPQNPVSEICSESEIDCSDDSPLSISETQIINVES